MTTTNPDFDEAVTMTATQLEKWLATEESKKVGQKSGGSGESVGHDSGRRIIEILRTKKADLTEADEAQILAEAQAEIEAEERARQEEGA